MTASAPPPVSVVIPNWNGRHWLAGCLASLHRQTVTPLEIIVVDNGSRDDSLAFLSAEHPGVRVLALGSNTGFAHAANRGIEAARAPAVALVNTDVELDADWIERTTAVLAAHPVVAAVACKMLSLRDAGQIYDAGDILRRDGVCEQRGRFSVDDGRYDTPEEIFGACAGAALYRRLAVLGVGGFDERLFAYLEDVDLALRLRLAGWRCRYEPVVARHLGEGSSSDLPGGHHALATRNTVLLVARWFPVRWLGYVAYRQLAWVWHAARERRLAAHLRALASALPLLPSVLRDRHSPRARPVVALDAVIPARPFHGPRAGGHPAQVARAQRPLR